MSLNFGPLRLVMDRDAAAKMSGLEQAKRIIDGIVNGLKIVLTFIGVVTLAIGITIAFVLVWGLSSQPFLSELVGDATRASDIRLVLTPALAGTCAGLLAAVGLASGLLPALKASRLDPIEPLRHE